MKQKKLLILGANNGQIQLIKAAKEEGYSKIIGEYIKTPKNAMVEKIYSNMGFNDIGNGKFEALVKDFKYNNTNIKKN